MSELYVNLTPMPDRDVPERSCACCQRPISTRSQVHLPQSGLILCRQCANDLADSLASKATTIPVHPPPQAGSRRMMQKADTPWDSANFQRNMRREFYAMLLAYMLDRQD
jgi:hypothetical protein